MRWKECILIIAIIFFLIPPVLAEDAADWYIKARNAEGIGDYPTALQYYNNALLQNANYASAYAGKAGVLNRLARYSEALAAADKALSIKRDAAALDARGYALFSLGKDTEAVHAYDALFMVQENVPDAYYVQGRAYLRLNETEKAINAFDRCVYYNPKHIDGWNQKGLALISIGRYSDALEAYNQATRISTTNAVVWNNKGLAFAGIGDYQNAMLCFKTALSLDPSFAEAKTNLDKAYQRTPFFTSAATVTTVPVAPVTAEQTKTPVPTKAETMNLVLTPTLQAFQTTQNPVTVPKTTYSPVPPAIIIVALVSAFFLTVVSRCQRRR